jgi:hypothetical protein
MFLLQLDLVKKIGVLLTIIMFKVFKVSLL